MAAGIPYDSAEGRAICGAISPIMTGVSYATSAPRWPASWVRSRATSRTRPTCCASSAIIAARLTVRTRATRSWPWRRCRSTMPPLADKRLVEAARRAWDRAIELGQEHGYRNAQATVVAPTGTIGLVMDCDTTGIEPDFALVKFKKLAGGGYFKIINQAVPEALRGARLPRERDRRDRGLRGRPRLAAPGPRDQPRDAEGQGASPTRSCTRSRAVLPPPSTSSSCSTDGRSARSSSPARLKVPAEKLADPGVRPARASRLLEEGYRGRQRARLRRHDAGRRAAPEEASTCPCSTAPTPAAARASATSRSRATSA